MTKHTVHVDFPGRFVFIGFGSIGQGVLPLIMRHIGTRAGESAASPSVSPWYISISARCLCASSSSPSSSSAAPS